MSTIKLIKSGLIEKIQAIQDKNQLLALDALLTGNRIDALAQQLSAEQQLMLEMSERDIQDGNIISQEALVQRNQKWLNAK